MIRKWAEEYLNQSSTLSPEDGKFWYRRFTTSLSIGNGAALIALASYAASSDFNQTVSVIRIPFSLFSAGLVLSGITPMFLGLKNTIDKASPKTGKFTGKENPENAQYQRPILDALSHASITNIHIALLLISSILFTLGLIFLNMNLYSTIANETNIPDNSTMHFDMYGNSDP